LIANLLLKRIFIIICIGIIRSYVMIFQIIIYRISYYLSLQITSLLVNFKTRKLSIRD